MDIHYKEAILFAESLVSYVMNKLIFRHTPYSNLNVLPRSEEFRRSSVYNGFTDSVREVVDFLLDNLSCSIESRYNDIVESGDLSRQALLDYSKRLWDRYLADGTEVISFLRYCVMMAGLAVHFFRGGLTWAPDVVNFIIVDRLPTMGACRISWDNLQTLVNKFVQETLNGENASWNDQQRPKPIPSASGENTSDDDSSSCACFQREIVGGTFQEIYIQRYCALYKHKFNCCGGGVDIGMPVSFNRGPCQNKRFSYLEELNSYISDDEDSEDEEFSKFSYHMTSIMTSVLQLSPLDATSEQWLRDHIEKTSCQHSSNSRTTSEIVHGLATAPAVDVSGQSTTCDLSDDGRGTSSTTIPYEKAPSDSRAACPVNSPQGGSDDSDDSDEQLSDTPFPTFLSVTLQSIQRWRSMIPDGILRALREYNEIRSRERRLRTAVNEFFAKYKCPLHVRARSTTEDDLLFPDLTNFLKYLMWVNGRHTSSDLSYTDSAGVKHIQLSVILPEGLMNMLKNSPRKETGDSENASSGEGVNLKMTSHSNKSKEFPLEKQPSRIKSACKNLDEGTSSSSQNSSGFPDDLPSEKQSSENMSESSGSGTLDKGSSSSSQYASGYLADAVASVYLKRPLSKNRPNLFQFLSSILGLEEKPANSETTRPGEAPSRSQSLPSRSDQLDDFPLGRRSEIHSRGSSRDMELDSGSSSASYRNLMDYSAGPVGEIKESSSFLDEEKSPDPQAVLSDIEDESSSSSFSGKYPELRRRSSSSGSEPSTDLGK